MEREKLPLTAPDLLAIYGPEPVQIRHDVIEKEYQEDHSLIPGQGIVKIRVVTLLDLYERISQVKVIRGENSLIPSTLTEYAYYAGGKGRVEIENRLYSTSFRMPLVDKVDKNGTLISLKEINPDLFDLFSAFADSFPGREDFGFAIEKAKRLNHPAFRVIRDEAKVKSVLSTTFWTDSDGITYLVARLRNFKRTNGKYVLTSSVMLFNLRGLQFESWVPEQPATKKKFIYDEKGIVGKETYTADHLDYTDTYYPRPFLIGDTTIAVFDVEQKEEEKKTNYKFEDLLSKDPKFNVSKIFGGSIKDEGEKKVGGTFTRFVEFPTLPQSKKIKAVLRVISLSPVVYEPVEVEVV